MMSGFLRSLTPIFVFTLVYAATALVVTNSYYQLILTLVLVWASMGLSWNILSGYTGLLSFGHAAFFGLGAYSVVLAHVHFGITPWVSIPFAAVLGGAAGFLVGLPTFRLKGHYFGLAMLAYPLALINIFEWLGYQEVSVPMERGSPAAFMQFSDGRVYTLIALGLLLSIVIVTLVVERSRFGMALLAIKQNEAAAEAAGIDTLRWKLLAISLSGAIAAIVGGFYAVVLLVVTPVAVFGMLVSAQALVVAMFGGVGTVWGPIVGALTLVPVGEMLHAELGSKLPGIQGVIYGIAIVAVSIAAPGGVFWKFRDLLRSRGLRATVDVVSQDCLNACDDRSREVRDSRRQINEGGEVILEVRGISKSFLGLKAVQNVSFSVRRGMILGIIGPNGAGKTTVFNLLNGFSRPDKGEVIFAGQSMQGKKPHLLCRAGIGRTFQVMRPFARMTIAENVLIGAYVRANSDNEAKQFAQQAIARVGLSASANRIASDLTSKELRLMELARALAGRPQILLLDETLAGLGHSESEEVIAVIRRLADDDITIVIIEHTMRAMVRLVDRFLVLDHGEVLLEDTPENVTKDPRVVEAYLGKKWSTAHVGS